MKLVSKYIPNDIIWYRDHSNEVHYIFKILSQWVVKTGTRFMVLDAQTEQWVPFDSRIDVERHLKQQRLGTYTFENRTFIVSAQDISNFFLNGVLTMSATIYAPGSPLLCLFNGQKRLNTWKDCRTKGVEDHMRASPAVEGMLKVIRNSLCDEPDELSLDEMIAEINSDRQTPFRWVMHWLGARYQFPGFTPFTNLWFVGESRGVGKGTLVLLMGLLLGRANVGKINKSDIEKGWSGSLANKELVEWDEFKTKSGMHDLSDFIKLMTGNPTISVNYRLVGDVEMPNVAMHIMQTNNKNPMLTDKNDRQNTFVGTTSNFAHWRDQIAKLFAGDGVGEFADDRIVTGFAHVLQTTKVDFAFIKAPLVTKKAVALRNNSQDPVLRWVISGAMEELARSDKKFEEWERLYDLYRYWVQDYVIHHKPYDLSEFKERMRHYEIVGEKDEPRKVGHGPMRTTKRVAMFNKIMPSDHGGEDLPLDEDDGVVDLSARRRRAAALDL